MAKPDAIKRYRVIVSGRVQGVCFRYYTEEKARELSIKGWVRNLYSREVEALVEGKDADAQKMISWIKHGPPMAHVTGIRIVEEPHVPGEFNSFRITY